MNADIVNALKILVLFTLVAARYLEFSKYDF